MDLQTHNVVIVKAGGEKGWKRLWLSNGYRTKLVWQRCRSGGAVLEFSAVMLPYYSDLMQLYLIV